MNEQINFLGEGDENDQEKVEIDPGQLDQSEVDLDRFEKQKEIDKE